jgi:hypothetical protein
MGVSLPELSCLAAANDWGLDLCLSLRRLLFKALIFFFFLSFFIDNTRFFSPYIPHLFKTPVDSFFQKAA